MIVYCDIRKNYIVYNEVILMNNIKEEKTMDQNTVQQTSETMNEVAVATSGMSAKTKGIIAAASVATLGVGVGVYFLVKHIKAKKAKTANVVEETK